MTARPHQEIELKLRLQPEHIAPLRNYLNQRCEIRSPLALENTYFDNQDADLANAKGALRIRTSGEECEQTLKLSGKNQAGIIQRHEWNWPLSEPMLDLAHLQQDPVAQLIPDAIVLHRLSPVFTTHFERERWLWHEQDVSCEIVIDQGDIGAQGRKQALCELEIELISGDARLLWGIARTLGDIAPLWLSQVSKAERGYRLAGIEAAKAPHQNAPQPATLDQALHDWMLKDANALVRQLESALWDERISACAHTYRLALSLKTAPTWCGKIIKRQQTKALRHMVDQIIDAIKPLQDLAGVRSVWPDAPVMNEYRVLAARLRDDSALSQILVELLDWLNHQWPDIAQGEDRQRFIERMRKETHEFKRETDVDWPGAGARLIKLMLSYQHDHQTQAQYRQLGFMLTLQGLLVSDDWMRIFDQEHDGPEFAHYVKEQLNKAQKQL